MIEIYGSGGPSRSTRALWALEEAGAEYTFRRVELHKGEHRSEAYLAINPAGKVPALKDGDFVLTESGAIVTYIGEKFPETELVPTAVRERARYLEWVLFVTAELEQPLWTRAKHTFVLPEKLRVPAVKATAEKEFWRVAAVLEKRFGEGPYALGDRFTMADVLLGHTLAWARSVGLPVETEPLAAYQARVLGRPALARVQEREK